MSAKIGGTPWGCPTPPPQPKFVIRFNPNSGYPYWSVVDTRTEKTVQSYKLYRGAAYCMKAMNLYESGNVDEAGKNYDWAYYTDK